MSIYELYGRLAESQERTEASRQFLCDLVIELKTGVVKPEQVELTADGGFKVNDLTETEPDAEQDSQD